MVLSVVRVGLSLLAGIVKETGRPVGGSDRRRCQYAVSSLLCLACLELSGSRQKRPLARALGLVWLRVLFCLSRWRLRQFLFFAGREPFGSAKAGPAQ